jgi:hypothetical protein
MKVRAAGLVLALSTASIAHAIDDAAFQRCRGISDSANRLACYDALQMNTPPAAAQVPPIAPPKSTAAAAAPAPAKSAATSPAPVPAAPAAASAPTPPQQQAAAQPFGYESRAPAVEPPTTMESTIPGHFQGWGPGERIKLANGTVWQIVDDSRAYFNIDNPRAVVRRGMMGGFFLEIENSNRSPRVRRIQ